MHTIVLSDEEIENLFRCIDSVLFEEFDLFDTYNDYISNGENVEDIEALKKIIVPDLIREINDLIVLITHIDPEYDAETERHSDLYNLEKYRSDVKEKTKQFIDSCAEK